MRILFLDFDGVLNVDDSSNRPDYLRNPCEPEQVARLNTILERTGAKVVVSSSWRKGSCLMELAKYLSAAGFKGELIDITPGCFRKDLGRAAVRGDEIAYWLELAKLGGNDVESYVILDDDTDMLTEQRPFFVQTLHSVGLQDAQVERAVEILCMAADACAALMEMVSKPSTVLPAEVWDGNQGVLLEVTHG